MRRAAVSPSSIRLQISTSCSRVSKRDFAHLPQIHLDRIVQDIQAAFLRFLLRFGRLGTIQVGRFDDLDFEAAQLGINRVQQLRGNDFIRNRVVDVVVGEVALVLGTGGANP